MKAQEFSDVRGAGVTATRTGSIVAARDVTRVYNSLKPAGRSLKPAGRRGSEPVHALRGVDFAVADGECVAIMGPSGCGKSTLLGLLGGLDRPTTGTVELMGRDITSCSRHELAQLRRTRLGYVPQLPSLLPMLTVEENVALPLELLNENPEVARFRVAELLQLVDLAGKAHALPEELSGGQQQRVSIARALAGRPRLVLADEPAGSLDSVTARAMLAMVVGAVRSEGAALVLVTHERDEAQYADRVVYMRDGRLAKQDVFA